MARRKILTDDGRIEDEIDMEEAKSSNKELGLPDLDDEEGRSNSEPDGEDNPKKQKEPKNAKSKASAKQEQDDEEDEDEDDVEEGRRYKYVERGDLPNRS